MLSVLGDVSRVEGTFLRVALDGVAGVEIDFFYLGRVVSELTQFAVLYIANKIGTSLQTLAVEQVADVDILDIGCYLDTQVAKHAVSE